MFRILWLCSICTVVAISGCGKRSEPAGETPTQKPTPRAAVKLNILVVDDEKLAAGVNLLRGEWSERSGGKLVVSEMNPKEFLESEKLAADLVIYPSRYVGTLVARNQLRPIRDSLITSEQFDFNDLLPAIRDFSIRYGNQYYALTFGEPPLMLAYPQEALSEKGFFSWQDLPANLSEGSQSLHYPWATELIARTIASLPRQGHSSLLFHSKTMEAKIDGVPFEKALDEMLLLARTDIDTDQPTMLSIAWPTALSEPPQGVENPSVEFLPLPKAEKLYQAGRDVWETNKNEASSAIFWLCRPIGECASQFSKFSLRLQITLVADDRRAGHPAQQA